MNGCPVAEACAVACCMGEVSQQPMCPHCAHRRRCTHQPPAASHSTQPSPLGGTEGSIPAISGNVQPSSVSCQVTGSRTRNRVSPGDDSSDKSPWCFFTTMRHEMSRPRPVPSPTGLVVKNGSNIRFLISGGTPGPVSPNSTNTSSSRTFPVRTVSLPVPFIADTALSIRFVQTWFSSAAYAGICGSERSYSLTTLMPGGIFPDSISSVLSSRSRTSTTWYGARSSCEYCLAAPTSVVIRVVESSISFISSSVSTV